MQKCYVCKIRCTHCEYFSPSLKIFYPESPIIFIFCAAIHVFITQYPGKKVQRPSLVSYLQNMADRRKSTFDRRKSTFDRANEKPESATERGSIWIPLNPTAKHDDPFGKKFKMTRSDNRFVQMGTRFEELNVKRIYL